MSSKSVLRMALAGALTAGAADFPLYGGDPRVSSVSHPEWAKMLLRGLDLDAPQAKRASEVFAALSWHSSLSIAADDVERAGDSASYPLTVASEGDYSIRLRMLGRSDSPVTAEVARRGEARPFATFTFRPTSHLTWLEGGRVHLGPGSYVASVSLPPGTSLDRLEVLPPCVASLEPLGGWQIAKIATTTDIAVTLIRALGRESDLDPAGAPLEIAGSDIQRYLPALSTPPHGEAGFRGGETGADGLLVFEPPEAGLYTVLAKGPPGGRQRWLVDGCRKSSLCPGATPAVKEGGFVPLLTSQFSRGRHTISVRLGAAASLERVRFEPKRNEGAAYLEALRRLGLDLGPEGPAARSKAVEAMDWLRQQRAASTGTSCPDLARPTATPRQVVQIRQPGKRGRRAGDPTARPGIAPFVPPPQVARPVQ